MQRSEMFSLRELAVARQVLGGRGAPRETRGHRDEGPARAALSRRGWH